MTILERKRVDARLMQIAADLSMSTGGETISEPSKDIISTVLIFIGSAIALGIEPAVLTAISPLMEAVEQSLVESGLVTREELESGFSAEELLALRNKVVNFERTTESESTTES